MAAVIVEDGTNVTDANSYLSEGDATTYHGLHSESTVWSSASPDDKAKALRLATQYLDVQYACKWKGTRTNETQELAWPRTSVTDYDEFTIASNAMPQALKDATAEAALRSLGGDDLLFDLSTAGIINSETIIIGPIEKVVGYSAGESKLETYPMIEGLLSALVQSS